MSGFFLWNTDAQDRGDNLAYGFDVDYPNDLWSGGLGFTEVQPNHSPAVGFTPRRGFRGYNANVNFGPRPEAHRWIRQLTFSAGVDLRTDMDDETVTRTFDLTPFRVQFHSGDSFGFTVRPTYELLEDDFEISEGVILPAGADYSFLRYGFSFSTPGRRIIATNTSFESGEFMSGHRDEVNVNLGIRPMVGVVANLATEWNRIDLPEGEFQTRVHRATLDTQFNPWIFVVNNVQYDSVSKRLGWQIRFRWTVEPGNDLYLIYTQNWLDDPIDDRLFTQDRRGAAKFVYTYRW
jgi:hypothetical protein